MAGAGGLVIVLVAALIALGLSLGTVASAVYALVATNAQRGRRFGVAAVVGALMAIVLSSPFWIVVVRGRDTQGQRLRYPDSWPLAALVLFEAAVLALAVAGTVRQYARRR